MPELPEVETMVRGIRDAVIGRQLKEFARTPCQRVPIVIKPEVDQIDQRLKSASLDDVVRLAKRVVLQWSNGDRTAIEPRMTGMMLLTDPPSEEHLRVEWQFSGGRSLWFWDRRGLGTIQHYTAEQWQLAPEIQRIGPDALVMSVAQWQAALKKTSRPLKNVLLDQHVVAGIGNLYASEILLLIGVHPLQPAKDLTKRQTEKLAEATKEVLNLAIQYEGSTLSDGTYRNAVSQSGRYQNEHRVYKKEGEKCCLCRNGVIERIVVAQRATFFCPRCQKLK